MKGGRCSSAAPGEEGKEKKACFREKVGEGVWMLSEFQTLVLSEDYAGFAISVFFFSASNFFSAHG